MVEEKRKNGKLSVILGIVVLIVIVGLIGVGYLLKPKTPDQVFESVLTVMADKMKEFMDTSSFSEIDFKKNDFRLNGKIKVDTNYDLKEFAPLTDFTYGFDVDVSVAKKLAKVNLSMSEKEKEILSAKVFLQDKKGYMDIPGVLPYIMDLGDVDFDFDEFDNLSNEINKEEYKLVIEETKNMLIKTLDKTKFSMNKGIQKEYNGKSVEVIEYVYSFDVENQKRTWNEIRKLMLANEEYLKSLANISGVKVSKIKESLEKDSSEFHKDMSIVITMPNTSNTVIAVDLMSGEDAINMIAYNDKVSIQFDGVYIEYQKENGKEIISFEYESHNGKMIIEETKKDNTTYEANMRLEYNYNTNNININLDTSINFDADVKKENVKNAKTEEEYTTEEQSEILQNFLDKISGTSLETLLSTFMSGIL